MNFLCSFLCKKLLISDAQNAPQPISEPLAYGGLPQWLRPFGPRNLCSCKFSLEQTLCCTCYEHTQYNVEKKYFHMRSCTLVYVLMIVNGRHGNNLKKTNMKWQEFEKWKTNEKIWNCKFW